MNYETLNEQEWVALLTEMAKPDKHKNNQR